MKRSLCVINELDSQQLTSKAKKVADESASIKSKNKASGKEEELDPLASDDEGYVVEVAHVAQPTASNKYFELFFEIHDNPESTFRLCIITVLNFFVSEAEKRARLPEWRCS